MTAILESFKAAADTAMDLASRAKALPPVAPSADVGGRKPSLTKMVARVVEILPAGESFGPAAVTREINRHYGERLRRPVKRKLVSIVLRRMATDGRLRSVRPGKPHHEALREEGRLRPTHQGRTEETRDNSVAAQRRPLQAAIVP